MTDHSGGVLDEAYVRFSRTGPEWGEDQLTNHGPMAVEVLVRRGRADMVDRWVDRYVRRLDELPGPGDRITARTWPAALGDGRRLGDWSAYFAHEVTERPWREVLATWWPRLLPGIVAGTTHGVIRVGHVVRALLAGAESPATLAELAHGLAFWAARSRPAPRAAAPAGRLDPDAALAAMPRIPDQRGTVAARFGQFEDLDGWPASVAALRPAGAPGEVRERLADLVAAATLRYLRHGHGSPVLLVHTATAPNAVLHTLPALPEDLWTPSLAAAWTATAAIDAAYAPAEPAPRAALPGAPESSTDALQRAVEHGDEHVIKFTDTAVEVYARTGDPDALAAVAHIATLIEPVRA
ncbi:questin oxidase family protein [Phytohabitans sp. LJ34]|uniref:questin oxidase family protein n=1 Tax=Phytohabitans sp. LJ34 TaxID=3452217 RepID=UPI003F8CBF2C